MNVTSSLNAQRSNLITYEFTVWMLPPLKAVPEMDKQFCMAHLTGCTMVHPQTSAHPARAISPDPPEK